MIRTLIAVALVSVGAVGAADARPYRQYPYPPQIPVPQYPSYPAPQVPVPPTAGIEGQWYFRGDPNQPCSVQTVLTPNGPQTVLTNEKGTSTAGRIIFGGQRVIAYDWNITGELRGNALVWPNGDFWAR